MRRAFLLTAILLLLLSTVFVNAVIWEFNSDALGKEEGVKKIVFSFSLKDPVKPGSFLPYPNPKSAEIDGNSYWYYDLTDYGGNFFTEFDYRGYGVNPTSFNRLFVPFDIDHSNAGGSEDSLPSGRAINNLPPFDEHFKDVRDSSASTRFGRIYFDKEVTVYYSPKTESGSSSSEEKAELKTLSNVEVIKIYPNSPPGEVLLKDGGSLGTLYDFSSVGGGYFFNEKYDAVGNLRSSSGKTYFNKIYFGTGKEIFAVVRAKDNSMESSKDAFYPIYFVKKGQDKQPIMKEKALDEWQIGEEFVVDYLYGDGEITYEPAGSSDSDSGESPEDEELSQSSGGVKTIDYHEVTVTSKTEGAADIFVSGGTPGDFYADFSSVDAYVGKSRNAELLDESQQFSVKRLFYPLYNTYDDIIIVLNYYDIGYTYSGSDIINKLPNSVSFKKNPVDGKVYPVVTAIWPEGNKFGYSSGSGVTPPRPAIEPEEEEEQAPQDVPDVLKSVAVLPPVSSSASADVFPAIKLIKVDVAPHKVNGKTAFTQYEDAALGKEFHFNDKLYLRFAFAPVVSKGSQLFVYLENAASGKARKLCGYVFKDDNVNEFNLPLTCSVPELPDSFNGQQKYFVYGVLIPPKKEWARTIYWETAFDPRFATSRSDDLDEDVLPVTKISGGKLFKYYLFVDQKADYDEGNVGIPGQGKTVKQGLEITVSQKYFDTSADELITDDVTNYFPNFKQGDKLPVVWDKMSAESLEKSQYGVTGVSMKLLNKDESEACSVSVDEQVLHERPSSCDATVLSCSPIGTNELDGQEF